MDENKTEVWAVVDLFGHTRVAGRISDHVIGVAIPHLFPPPQPRRLGAHGRQIEHKPVRAITYDPPEKLFG